MSDDRIIIKLSQRNCECRAVLIKTYFEAQDESGEYGLDIKEEIVDVVYCSKHEPIAEELRQLLIHAKSMYKIKWQLMLENSDGKLIWNNIDLNTEIDRIHQLEDELLSELSHLRSRVGLQLTKDLKLQVRQYWYEIQERVEMKPGKRARH